MDTTPATTLPATMDPMEHLWRLVWTRFGEPGCVEEWRCELCGEIRAVVPLREVARRQWRREPSGLRRPADDTPGPA